MSGIYLHVPARPCMPRGEVCTNLARLTDSAVRLPSDVLATHSADTFCAAVIHHGLLPCGGLASSADGCYACLIHGTYTIHQDDTCYATPGDALRHLIGLDETAGAALSGQYAFAFVDRGSGRVVAETDRLGVHPLYYHSGPDGFTLASELKALRAFAPRALDVDAVAEAAWLGYVATTRTLLRDVRRVPPSHRLIYEQGRLRLIALPRVVFSRCRAVDDDLLDGMEHTFSRAVARAASVPLSASLSGGLDSRVALAAAKRAGAEVAAMSMGVPGSIECAVAGQFARRLGVPFRTHAFDGRRFADWFDRAVWVTEGRCPAGHMHFLDGMFHGAYDAAPQLHGLLGDVIAGGDYDSAAVDLRDADLTATRAACWSLLGQQVYWPGARLQACCAGPLRQALADVRERVYAELDDELGLRGGYSDYLAFRLRLRGSGFIIPALTSQATPWTDLVLPYLDPAFCDLCATVRREAILDRRAQIAWVLRAYPECAILPRVKDGVLVSVAAGSSADYDRAYRWLQRKKHLRYLVTRLSRGCINPPAHESYPYYDQWFRRWPSVRRYCRTNVLMTDTGLWDPAEVIRLLGDLRCGKNAWNAAGAVVLTSVFHKLFVEGSDVPDRVLAPPASLRPLASKDGVPCRTGASG